MKLKNIAATFAMKKLKLFLLLPIMASTIIPAVSAISTHAQSVPSETAPEKAPGESEGEAERGNILGRKKDCFATFTSNGRATYEIKLGQVNGLERRQKCLDLGITHANNSLDFRVFDFGYTGQQVCDQGGRVPIHVNTRVEDLPGSRDGNTDSTLKVRCEQKCTSTYVP
ncbi:hypothetical protein NIES4071_76980 [Calothrix sp. NIES-4071]|nr:hypothetical protein NIES4071_76980 [Calothrix sp. NIES-4071]BAZ61972.1 hypothetical protein NIES4105_76920 [Calothrix sp. NIES-4105]